MSAAIFGTGAKWHICVSSSRLTVWLIKLCVFFSAQYVLRRPTRGASAAHSRSFEMPRSRTVQFSRSFVLSCVRLWNGLHESIFTADEGVGAFKTSVNRFPLQGWLPVVSSLSSTIYLSFFLFPGPKITMGSLHLKVFCLYSCCFWSCL